MLTKNSKPIMFVLYMIESLHIKAIEAVPVTSAQNKDESKRCLDSIK
jgi:hypothetical protein